MSEQETIESEYIDNEEFEIKINDNKLKIELNNDEIKFTLMIGISRYKYIKNYKYDEIMKELNFSQYKDLKEIYNYLIKNKFKIINEEKKIILNNKEIRLIEKVLKNEELIGILIEEIREIKDDNKNQNTKIKELIREKQDKDNKIKILENKYNEIKELIYEIDDNIIGKYKNEINIIYETEKEGKYNIFGEEFIKKNKNNIELNINGEKSNLIKEYNLKKGNNNIKIIIKN